MIKFPVVLSVSEAETKCVVYTHTIGGDDKPFFIGVCRYHEVLCSPDAKQNSAWIAGGYDTVILEVLEITDNMGKAIRYRSAWMRKNGTPVCNAKGGSLHYRKRIRCVESGQIYEDQAHVSRATGISQSAISNHLNRRPGFKTCKGMTFERV